MKIVSSGKVLNSRGFYEKKRRRQRLKLGLLSFGFLLLLGFSLYFVRQPRFLITEVTVPAESVIDKEGIISNVKSLLGGYYLWFIPRASTFVYPRQAIEENFIVEFPRFRSVDLNTKNQALLISVEERIPSALYCTNHDECYFMDDGGLIFAFAPSFSGAVYLIYTTQDPIENPVGKRLMAVEEFVELSKFIGTLTVLDIHPVALEIRVDEYSLVLAGGGQIIWRKDSDFTLIRSNLEAFLSNDAIRAQNNFLDKIKSLDLRIDNKVFYKFKD